MFILCCLCIVCVCVRVCVCADICIRAYTVLNIMLCSMLQWCCVLRCHQMKWQIKFCHLLMMDFCSMWLDQLCFRFVHWCRKLSWLSYIIIEVRTSPCVFNCLFEYPTVKCYCTTAYENSPAISYYWLPWRWTSAGCTGWTSWVCQWCKWTQ